VKSDISQGHTAKDKKQQLHFLAGKILSGYKKKLSTTIMVKQGDRLPREVVEMSSENFRI